MIPVLSPGLSWPCVSTVSRKLADSREKQTWVSFLDDEKHEPSSLCHSLLLYVKVNHQVCKHTSQTS